MKSIQLIGAAILCLMLTVPEQAEAQTKRTVTVVKVERNRPVKRKVRRTKRKVRRQYRTLRKLPSGTRAVVYRSTSYYPVGGKFYIARKGVYVRTFPPVGFRVRTIGVTPLRLVVRSRPFWYAHGIFYVKNGSEFEVAEAPVGAVVPELPDEAEALDWDGVSAFELNNAVYREVADGYELIDLLEEED